MDFYEFLERSKKTCKSSNSDFSLNNSSAFTSASSGSGFSESKLIKSSTESFVQNPEASSEDLLKVIRLNIAQLSECSAFIRNLGHIKNDFLIKQLSEENFVLKLPGFKFNPKSIPGLQTFKSVKNGILNEPWVIRPLKLRKKPGVNFYEEPLVENILTVTNAFLERNIPFKVSSGKRFTISAFSSSVTTEKSHTKNTSLSNPKLREIIESSSSSSSSSEEVEIPKLYLERQNLYRLQESPFLCLCSKKKEYFVKKDYQNSFSNRSAFSTKNEKNNNKVVKFGYLTKRISKTNKFHQRWVVLKGFRFEWYRTHSSGYLKGSCTLTEDLITQTEAGKEKCLAIHAKERVFEFLNDKAGNDWKKVLNSQISFMSYLNEFNTLTPCLVEYFQDLDSESFVLREIKEVSVMKNPAQGEAKLRLFSYFCSAIPAHYRLETLDLKGCLLGDQIVVKLCETIRGNSHIKTLNLSDNNLSSQSSVAISQLLKQEDSVFNCIMLLDLSGNKIKDEGVEQISGALRVRFEQLFWPSLLHQLPFYSLKLNNVKMTDRGLSALTKLFFKTETLLQDEEIDARLSLEISGNYFGSSFNAFSDVVCGFQCISSLDISDNLGVPEDCIVFFAESLINSFSITTLNLSGLQITRKSYEKIFSFLSRNTVLRSIKISVQEEMKIALLDSEMNIHNLLLIK